MSNSFSPDEYRAWYLPGSSIIDFGDFPGVEDVTEKYKYDFDKFRTQYTQNWTTFVVTLICWTIIMMNLRK